MPNFVEKAAGCTIFSKIELRKGYHVIPVNPLDVQKTAITTPFSLFDYMWMPFGLRNAGASFQLHVDLAIRDYEAVFAWVDDIVICCQSNKEAGPAGAAGQQAGHQEGEVHVGSL